MQAQYTVAEFDIEGMEAAEEEREAEIDEDEEQTLVADWDTGMATEAYRAQVEAAQAEAREREEAEAAWIQVEEFGKGGGGYTTSGTAMVVLRGGRQFLKGIGARVGTRKKT